jgi:hypothetical protein
MAHLTGVRRSKRPIALCMLDRYVTFERVLLAERHLNTAGVAVLALVGLLAGVSEQLEERKISVSRIHGGPGNLRGI